MRAIITLITCFYCLSASAQNIILDPYFGNDGISFVENTSEITKIIQNPDGSIISAGYKIANGGGYHLCLTKHQANGTQDNNFGMSGITNTPIAYSDMILDLKLQTDGKILLAGSTYTGQDNSGGFPIFHAFVVRYHTNGMIDSSFAANGIFRVTDYDDSQFTSIIIQSDQSMLLIGNTDGRSAVTKLTSGGAIDPAFGTSGTQYLSDYSTFFFINSGGIRLNDGSILCYGMDGTDFNNSKTSCFKIDSLGNFITSFGQNGIASIDVELNPNSTEILSKAQELPNGRIILAGSATDKVILKINADGTSDSSFSVNGILNHTLPYKDMLVQPDGKILIGGSTEIAPSNYGISISRFNADGTIDLGFNSTGTFETDLSERSDLLQSMILTSPSHLLIGGGIRPIDFNSVFGLTQIDMSESLGLKANISDEFSIYPNPFSDKVTVLIGNESVTTIQISDATGRLIDTYPANKSTVLSLEHLESGMYHIVFINKQHKQLSQKLIKQ